MVRAMLGNTKISRVVTSVTLNMYEILNVSEKFDDLDKMETTSSESKVKM